MRKALDLFCNLRPVKVPEENKTDLSLERTQRVIYFRALLVVNVTDDLAVRFQSNNHTGN
jgi:isocitrate/isopropylmalate dehydrogenase